MFDGHRWLPERIRKLSPVPDSVLVMRSQCNVLHSAPARVPSALSRIDHLGDLGDTARTERKPVFTGIVEEQGTVSSIESHGSGVRIVIDATTVLSDVEMGASIAVNGCCLTVVEFSGAHWAADAVPETMDRTNLGRLTAGDQVNLERPMQPTSRMGGHIVQGHIDGIASILAIDAQDDGSWRYRFGLSPELAGYVVEKGSIALDGISLTIAAIGPDWFEMAIIPHTASVTNLGKRSPGDVVNVEVDILAKYVERQLAANLKQTTEQTSMETTGANA